MVFEPKLAKGRARYHAGDDAAAARAAAGQAH